MKIWNNFINTLNKVVKFSIIFAFSLLFIVVLMQVVWRYILELPLPWTEEAGRYLLVWMSLLAISICFRDESHIRLDFFYIKFSLRIQKTFKAVFQLLSMGFIAVLISYGLPHALSGKVTYSQGLGITMVSPYLSVPVSGCIMGLNLLDNIIRTYSRK